MKIRLLSDLHTEVTPFEYIRLDEDVLVLAGDIGVGKRVVRIIKDTFPTDIPIIFVFGNHEFYHNDHITVKEYVKEEFKDTNVHVLDNESIVINGVRFIGGTMFSDLLLFEPEGYNRFHTKVLVTRSINDFYVIQNDEYNRTWDIEDHLEEFEKFEKYIKYELHQPYKGRTVVVTHFCPSEGSVHPRWAKSAITPYFTSNMERYMGFSKLWLHGHTHDTHDYEVAGTRVVCNPKGYGQENKTGFNPNLILEV